MDTQTTARPIIEGYTLFSATPSTKESIAFTELTDITIEDVIDDCQHDADKIEWVLIHDKLKFFTCLHASGKFSTVAINKYAYGSLEECYNLLVQELGDGTETLDGFIVLEVLVGGGSYQPVFSDDDGLMFFTTEAEALAEIQDSIKSVQEAVDEGSMSTPDTIDNYKIIPATLKASRIYCSLDGDNYEMERTEDDWTKVN